MYNLIENMVDAFRIGYAVQETQFTLGLNVARAVHTRMMDDLGAIADATNLLRTPAYLARNAHDLSQGYQGIEHRVETGQ